MTKRPLIVLLLSVVFGLTLSRPLWAGGWVVVTLDALPRQVIAGETLELGFTVRQHGQTLINVSGPALEAHNPTTGETVEATARQDGFTGHYRVQVRFPSAGVWQWQINPNSFTTVATMPPLTVRAANVTVTAEPSSANPLWQIVQLVQQWWVQVVGQPVLAEQLVVVDDDTSYGRDLFLAKGCRACHHHDALAVEWSTQEGPDLTTYDKTDTFLRLWLADPAAVKPTTLMPNLNLTTDEIDALTAFLTLDAPAVQ
jgi:hypothetical protein